jgi:alditol oxidase
LKNWAGNIEYGTEHLCFAYSLEDVQKFVKNQPRVKALGTRHCFNHIADSKHSFLSLEAMGHAVDLNSIAHTVTVPAGMTYGALSPLLYEQGFALHNLASLPHISVAGACATATHGSGEKNGNLATAVTAIELVTAAGEVVHLSRQGDSETFCAVVVGLGAFGVITKITLEVQPAFVMRQVVYENLPFANLIENFDTIQTSGYSVSLFTDWQNQRINEVWIKSRINDEQEFHLQLDFFGATAATEDLHPIAGISAENCTEQMGIPGPWHERLPHFRMGFLPSIGDELQSEYFVPRHNAVEAILAIERLNEQIAPHLLITEIRTIAADDLWLSPCYGRPSVAIHFTWKRDWEVVRALLPIIERELAPFQPKPHWGKLFTVPPAQLKASYEKLREFSKLAAQFDPDGKFRNEFLDANVFNV